MSAMARRGASPPFRHLPPGFVAPAKPALDRRSRRARCLAIRAPRLAVWTPPRHGGGEGSTPSGSTFGRRAGAQPSLAGSARGVRLLGRPLAGVAQRQRVRRRIGFDSRRRLHLHAPSGGTGAWATNPGQSVRLVHGVPLACPADPGASLRSSQHEVRLLGRSPALPGGSGATPPKRRSAVQLRGGAPPSLRGRLAADDVGLITRKRELTAGSNPAPATTSRRASGAGEPLAPTPRVRSVRSRGPAPSSRSRSPTSVEAAVPDAARCRFESGREHHLPAVAQPPVEARSREGRQCGFESRPQDHLRRVAQRQRRCP